MIFPQHHLVDMGYTSARLIVSSQQEYNVDLFGPVAANAQWQVKEEAGFDLFNFKVNWKQKVVRCPQGKPSRLWKNSHDAYAHILHQYISTRFGARLILTPVPEKPAVLVYPLFRSAIS